MQSIKHVESNASTIAGLKSLRKQMLTLEETLSKQEKPVPLYQIYDSSFATSNTKELKALAPLRVQERELLNSILPKYFTGNARVLVATDFVTLDTDVQLTKSVRPGKTQTLNISIKDSEGNPISGETTLTVVDASLLALKNFSSQVDTFYTTQYSSVSMMTNLDKLVKRIDFSALDRFGSSGGERDDMLKSSGMLFGSSGWSVGMNTESAVMDMAPGDMGG